MNREFVEVRRPLFKAVSHESMDRSSQLCYKYLRKELTPEIVRDSGENPFVVAFVYNELYDIREYLQHLKNAEITNQSYNIIKHYLKYQDRSFIVKYFDSPHHHNANSCVLRILKGEVYRICQYAVDDFDEYFFAGYVSIGDIILPCFEEVFAEFVTRNPRVIGVLDISSQRVRRAILARASYHIDYLTESSLLEFFLDELDFGALSADQIASILVSKNFEKSRVPDFLAKVGETSKFFDAIRKGGLEIYLSSRSIAMEKISGLREPIDHATNYFYLMLYYEPGLFDSKAALSYFEGHEDSESFKILLRVPGVEIDRNHLYSMVRGVCSERDVSQTAELFARFSYTLEFQAPDLADILDLPEKFFSYALKFVDTPCAKNLQIFNDNLLNERLKKHVSGNISRDVFVRYLIKRHKLFSIELDGYEHMMDDEYKLMYAQYSLRWASKNIEMLNRIGIPERLYRSLSSSPFKDCLAGVVSKPAGLIKTEAPLSLHKNDTSLDTSASKKLKL